jgi:hypothetical protein
MLAIHYNNDRPDTCTKSRAYMFVRVPVQNLCIIPGLDIAQMSSEMMALERAIDPIFAPYCVLGNYEKKRSTDRIHVDGDYGTHPCSVTFEEVDSRIR